MFVHSSNLVSRVLCEDSIKNGFAITLFQSSELSDWLAKHSFNPSNICEVPICVQNGTNALSDWIRQNQYLKDSCVGWSL